MKLEILFEDEDVIIVNKPAKLLVIPDRFDPNLDCLKDLLEQKYQQKIFVVHRLDKDTSGVICFARNETAHRYLSGLFQDRETEKIYIGLIHGQLPQSEGRIEVPIAPHPGNNGKMVTNKKGKPAITDYRVIKQWPLYSLVEFQIHTGRTHQIRVHMQSLGHSLVCDPLYGDGQPFFLSSIKKKYKVAGEEERPLLDRLALHAQKLCFQKENGTSLTIEAPIPKDITATIRQLDKWN